MGTDTAELAPLRETRRARSSYNAPGRKSASQKPSSPASPSPAFGRDIYCTLDALIHCLHLSGNYQAMTGFTAEGDMGDGLKDRIAPDHIRKVSHYLQEADLAAIPVRFQIKHKDGHWRWCEMQLLQAQAENFSKNIAYQCLLSDITETVLAAGKLEKARLEADIANKSRSEFLANMSHELRTPLNAILGFAQMIESGTFGDIGHPKYHDYIGSIQESGGALLSKINDLLEIANIDSGRMTLNESCIDLTDVIRQAVESHSHRAFAEQIVIRDKLPKDAMLVSVDRIRMLQVLTSLISNAIKYNRAGGVVDITCEKRKDGGISIIIEDNGGGIPATHLQNILSAFRQDNSFFARSRDCVGLGLALAKEIVKLHHGRIEIESEPGKGTLLTIRLPKERSIMRPAEKTLESSLAVASN